MDFIIKTQMPLSVGDTVIKFTVDLINNTPIPIPANIVVKVLKEGGDTIKQNPILIRGAFGADKNKGVSVSGKLPQAAIAGDEFRVTFQLFGPIGQKSFTDIKRAISSVAGAAGSAGSGDVVSSGGMGQAQGGEEGTFQGGQGAVFGGFQQGNPFEGDSDNRGQAQGEAQGGAGG